MFDRAPEGGGTTPHKESISAWVQRARPHLAPFLAAAGRLEEEVPSNLSREGVESADRLVHEADVMLEWLLADPCPHPDAEIELRAALGVCRNAAFAFRRLSLTNSRSAAGQLRRSCARLLAQGRHHLLSFQERTVFLDP